MRQSREIVNAQPAESMLWIHLFELPKYKPPRDNRVITDPVEQWLYFFCRASESTVEQLATMLPDPVFAEATLP